MFARLSAAVLLLPLTGCSNPVAPCEGPLTLHISSTREPPRVTWGPACGITHLTLARRTGAMTVFVWGLETTAGVTFGPTIQLGRTPWGVRATGAAAAITPGSTYRLTISRRSGDVLLAEGNSEFDYVLAPGAPAIAGSWTKWRH